MAKMYPERPICKFKSSAERMLYDVLSDGLSDDYEVLYGVSWTLPTEGRLSADYEADFIVAHPDRGLLVIEVKGGELLYENGVWYRLSGEDKERLPKSPVDQVRATSYSLVEKLRSHPATGSYFYNVNYALWFPDARVPRDELPVGMAPELVMDWTDVKDPQSAVERAFDYYNCDAGMARIGSDAISALVRACAKSLFIRTPLAKRIERDVDKIVELTEQQFNVLDVSEHRRRAYISGCAGSGKTMLALEKARRLSLAGMRVLFTCFNKNLAKHLAKVTRSCPDYDGVRFTNYHKLCFEVASLAGMPLSLDDGWSDERKAEFWEVDVADRLLKAVEHLSENELYDAVIVDEGQDFSPLWLESLELLLKSPSDGVFYVFYDDNQSIYQDAMHGIEPDFRLTYDLRNTKHIFRRLKAYLPPDSEYRPHSKVPDGRECEWIKAPEAEWAHEMEKLLSRLVDDGAIPSEHIVILTPFSAKNSIWGGGVTLGDFRLVWDERQVGERDVLCSTIQSFKGLERPVVILTELDKMTTDFQKIEELLYVGVSRAMVHLIILGQHPLGDFPDVVMDKG